MTARNEPRAKQSLFRITLPSYSKRYTVFSGAREEEVYGRSPLHALSNYLRKMGLPNLVDDFYNLFQNGSAAVKIELSLPGSRWVTTRYVPELDAMRRIVAQAQKKTMRDVKDMKYERLFELYRGTDEARRICTNSTNAETATTRPAESIEYNRKQDPNLRLF